MPKFTEENKRVIKKVEKQALSGEDIFSFLPKDMAKIMIYKDLKDYETMDHLFGTHSIILLLYPVVSNEIGHWVILIKFSKPYKYVEFNCSYGSKLDQPLSWVPRDKLIEFGINEKYLSNLFAKYRELPNCVYNRLQFQKKKNGVSTCGRFACLRGILYIRNKYDLFSYQRFMKNLKKELNQDYDFIATGLINEATQKKGEIR